MKALSLLPPGFRGVERGWGSSECVLVRVDVTEDGAGERRKPPDWAGGVDIVVECYLRCFWVSITLEYRRDVHKSFSHVHGLAHVDWSSSGLDAVEMKSAFAAYGLADFINEGAG